eukprot:1251577-Pleurochrysis_carterae.AAC.1
MAHEEHAGAMRRCSLQQAMYAARAIHGHALRAWASTLCVIWTLCQRATCVRARTACSRAPDIGVSIQK